MLVSRRKTKQHQLWWDNCVLTTSHPCMDALLARRRAWYSDVHALFMHHCCRSCWVIWIRGGRLKTWAVICSQIERRSDKQIQIWKLRWLALHWWLHSIHEGTFSNHFCTLFSEARLWGLIKEILSVCLAILSHLFPITPQFNLKVLSADKIFWQKIVPEFVFSSSLFLFQTQEKELKIRGGGVQQGEGGTSVNGTGTSVTGIELQSNSEEMCESFRVKFMIGEKVDEVQVQERPKEETVSRCNSGMSWIFCLDARGETEELVPTEWLRFALKKGQKIIELHSFSIFCCPVCRQETQKIIFVGLCTNVPSCSDAQQLITGWGRFFRH